MASSPIARVSPTVRQTPPEENAFFPKPVAKPHQHIMTICSGKTKRESTLIQVIIGCKFIVFVLLVVVTFLSLKLYTVRGVDGDCVDRNMTETECYRCGPNGVPGVETLLKSSNGICCVRKSDFDPIRAQIAHDTPSQKRLPPKEKKKVRNLKLWRLPSAHLHLNLSSTEERHDGVLVWQASQFDGINYIQGALFPTGNGSVRVRLSGIYRITVHVCLDAINNPMEAEKSKVNINLYIIKTSTRVAHYDKMTLFKGTYHSQTVEMNLSLGKNESFHILSTWEFLYKMDFCNSLDINMISR